ncbi:MAG: hypothetical protein HKN10_18160 [Myxococcales bacterium]|nr:hypothetical protein [Myxococcales bacterium]
MSSFEGYALIIPAFLGSMFAVVYLTRAGNEAVYDVLLGVVRGVPISIEQRWLTLLQVYLGMCVGILMVEFFLLFVSVGVASEVESPVKELAYLAGGVAGLGFIFQVGWAILIFARCRSVLREAEQKSK